MNEKFLLADNNNPDVSCVVYFQVVPWAEYRSVYAAVF